jgi:hypothetical protein
MTATGGASSDGEPELCYEPRRDRHGLIDVEQSLLELAPLVDATWKADRSLRALPWGRRRLVAVQLEHARRAWTAMNAAGGLPPA